MAPLDGNAHRPALICVKGRLPGGSRTGEPDYAPAPVRAAGIAAGGIRVRAA